MIEYKTLDSIAVIEEWKKKGRHQDKCRKPEEVVLLAVQEEHAHDGWELVTVAPNPNANMGLIAYLKRQF